MKMIVAQRRKDVDIGHLPPKVDESKPPRYDRRKPNGIKKGDPDLSMEDPDLKSGSMEVARELVAMARELLGEEADDVR